MMKLAIFASGSGTNFQAIVDAVKKGDIQANIEVLVCDKTDAKVIERAANEQIDCFVFQPKKYENKAEYEKEILAVLQKREIDFIALAGYMRLVGSTLLQAYQHRIINIHPSLLPSFPGKDAIGQAIRAGVKVTGVTIHYVDEGMDTGPIIAQQAVSILENDTEETLAMRIHEVEHALYTKVLKEMLGHYIGGSLK
ncbi:phosphoribosylglycinamide formyltransferase [Heyndrickxia ginsengihumi]|uniref:Phosphoribosylglycinamide formyltransferase n=1 Tax=Heyndrickxia ginsengihumi TaxID=363870 RepID=A0A6M0P973_9BACI|nr:phosphoribosylglycinamide formyltransferase [Heyndrickxia ginsengihumi]MCM3023769.1 phosphoribosylglycinamide formyltransferase [Heyndrickxia ginsengihumi]NEY21294.1 phosphoribosylglycinamide formyltransferase [Heyndrickxia ginsengihumi]